jgi:hypothetical protein
MFDKEIEAIAKCTELIKDLDDNAKMRVMKYLIERFGIGMEKSQTMEMSESNGQEGTKLINSISDNDYEDVESESVESDKDFPSLRDLVIKDYPKNEAEWVLVYGFYSSNYGKDTFTRENILSKYEETNRKTDARRKNLSKSVSTGVKKDWFKSMNDKEYIILDEGKKYVSAILAGNSSGSTRKKVKKTR